MKTILSIVLLAFCVISPSLAFAEPGTATVDVNGITYEVSYDATGLTVSSMEADTKTDTLTIYTTTGSVQSTLQIVLERSFFDSQVNGEDEDFIVLADGFETPFDEAKTDTARTLTITVPANTSSIDIISLGTEGFATGSAQPQTPSETPQQTPAETPTETPSQTPTETPQAPQTQPETQCGPGTVLKDGECVLEEQPQQTPSETPTETPQAPQTQPETQCGPGTVLKDGACVLEGGCGPGTVFKDGQCALIETPQGSSLPQGGTFQLGLGLIVAFVISFIIMMILWGIGRASRRKSNSQ